MCFTVSMEQGADNQNATPTPPEAAASSAESIIRPVTQRPARLQVQEGSLIADKYKLVSRVGGGAMGSVWKAEHITLGHAVACKFLTFHPHLDVDDATRRFEREARLSARLGEISRHIVRVFDHGIYEEHPFLIMEFLKGEDLATCLRREKRLAIDTVAAITLQLCRALSVAHEAGVVHRDLKPGNIFLCEGEGQISIKLFDFGVAKTLLDRTDIETTSAGVVIGSPGFISPEQLRDPTNVDARADLWAVGVTVYLALLGEPAFGRGPAPEVFVRILSHEPKAPSLVDPSLGPDFDAWVARALAKDRTQRFQSAEELCEALFAALGVADRFQFHMDSFMPRPMLPRTLSTTSEVPVAMRVEDPPSSARKRWLALGVGLMFAAALFVAGVIHWVPSADAPVVQGARPVQAVPPPVVTPEPEAKPVAVEAVKPAASVEAHETHHVEPKKPVVAAPPRAPVLRPAAPKAAPPPEPPPQRPKSLSDEEVVGF